jgi:hypothetical protein
MHGKGHKGVHKLRFKYIYVHVVGHLQFYMMISPRFTRCYKRHSEHMRRTLADNARQESSQDHSSTTDGHQIGNVVHVSNQVSQRDQRPTENQIRRTKYSNNVHRIRPLVERCDISSYKACKFYRSVPDFSHPNSVRMYTLH